MIKLIENFFVNSCISTQISPNCEFHHTTLNSIPTIKSDVVLETATVEATPLTQSYIDKEITAALSLDLSISPSMHRTDPCMKMPIKSIQNASPMEQLLILYTALRWGVNSTAITCNNCMQIWKAVSPLV